jgi:hypothetical protein
MHASALRLREYLFKLKSPREKGNIFMWKVDNHSAMMQKTSYNTCYVQTEMHREN